MSLTTYSMAFNGQLLQRGFWLYVWSIQSERELYLYVGRTGDSSSSNASSPFQRIARHLDFSITAKSNSISKQLNSIGIDPRKCFFEMTSIGPLFTEQADFNEHKLYRDKVGALEAALAKYLSEKGYRVIGSHAACKNIDETLWCEIKKVIDEKF